MDEEILMFKVDYFLRKDGSRMGISFVDDVMETLEENYTEPRMKDFRNTVAEILNDAQKLIGKEIEKLIDEDNKGMEN